ncbi:mitochondrial import inner membrane translocase subunit tim9 [Ascobolus immersus RN42]|uniref:Mitochondrial import inner membrane translocase subunit n=1 Tax=Ascobolus immersus RN42 TaxID=1160509 RepID=A0A3N4I3G9_ASCIM|nr:mitochondrial import inner membrane translocase subunit tim9 [Ascobolus immersus RN42]
MEALNAQEQKEFQQVLERRQMNEYVKMYSNLVQRCFDHCVNDFTSKSLIQKEEACLNRCVDKFLKGAERMGQRFQELNAQQQ